MLNKPDRYGLQFNVSQLLKESTGATRHYNVNTPALGWIDDDTVVITPLVGEVKFLRTGPDVLVSGRLEATVQKSCGRCLELFNASIVVELEEQFYPTVNVVTGVSVTPPPDADESNAINDQHILDLLEVVRQAFLLENDSARYCRPDCQGICKVCGQNLNLESCDCHNDTMDLRWAGLLKNLEIEE